MKRLELLSFLIICHLYCSGQIISVTFTASGSANQIDSIKATNLTVYKSITLPGNATLILFDVTGIPSISDPPQQGVVFPNPFSGRTTFKTHLQKAQTIFLKVLTLTGQTVSQKTSYIQPGDHEFSLSVSKPGIYLVVCTSGEGTAGYKVLCTGKSAANDLIQYVGPSPELSPSAERSGIKTSSASYSLSYTIGHVMHYKCYSGIFTTIITDSPESSKDYKVEFAACSDNDDKNYSIVRIGNQTWMAENLSWLPAVSPALSVSQTAPLYYVNGYQGIDAGAAKATDNYMYYGVLYNWAAAVGACPSGWHLPGDSEWKTLEICVGMNPPEADSSGWRISGSIDRKLKSQSWWRLFPYNPYYPGDNSSGFNAKPGGFLGKYNNWYFDPTTFTGSFWTGSESDTSHAWCRKMEYCLEGMLRSKNYTKEYGMSVRCIKDYNGNSAPVAGLALNTLTGTPDTVFMFDATGCSDAETDISDLVVRWDWNGDGTWDTDYDKTKMRSHQFPLHGRYFIIMEVKDEDGFTDSESILVTVGEGIFTDNRDGSSYAYKTIGNQTWMIQNLAFLESVSPSSLGSESQPYSYVHGYEGTDVGTARASLNYYYYGALYNWEAAKNICPAGWHLPTDAEWKVLTDYVAANAAGKTGKPLASSWGWNFGNINGSIGKDQGSNNQSRFSALPGGYRSDRGARGLLTDAAFWSSTRYDLSLAWDLGLGADSSRASRNTMLKWNGYSVRCLKGSANPVAGFIHNPPTGIPSTVFRFDASGSADSETAAGDLEVRWDWEADGTWDTGYSKTKTISRQFVTAGNHTVILEVRDADLLTNQERQIITVVDGMFTDSRDSHEYVYKTIGTQTWMAENLAYLPQVNPPSAGAAWHDKYYYVYGYEGTSVGEAKQTEMYEKYGVLYNWVASLNDQGDSYEVPSGVQGVCPPGWHLPSNPEWKILTEYLNKNHYPARDLASTSGWSLYVSAYDGIGKNETTNNKTGFSIYPAGRRSPGGYFENFGYETIFWSTTGTNQEGHIGVYHFRLKWNISGIDYGPYWDYIDAGFPVRCLRD